jgi:hypothetical protein
MRSSGGERHELSVGGGFGGGFAALIQQAAAQQQEFKHAQLAVRSHVVKRYKLMSYVNNNFLWVSNSTN